MTFEVETSSLDHTIDAMTSELESISQISKRLYASLTALDGMWEGVAHSTFANQYLTDQEKLGEMATTISKVIEGLESARKTYEEYEQRIRNKVNKIRI